MVGSSVLVVSIALLALPPAVYGFVGSSFAPALSHRRLPTWFYGPARSARAVSSSPRFRTPIVPTSCPPSALGLRMKDAKPADVFSTCTVKSNKAVGEDLRFMTVEVDSDIFSSYKVPGQYVKVRKDSDQEKPSFFAIASAPGASSNELEFLIKRTDGSAWMADAKKEATVEMTVAQGPGFKYADGFGDEVSNVILLATGSGIAPLKAVVESGDLKAKSPTLYYGARSLSEMAFQDKFDEWESMGFNVVPVLSQPEGKWEGRTGYIQNCLKEDLGKEASESGVLMCGVNDMVKEAKEILKDAGVPESKVLMNF